MSKNQSNRSFFFLNDSVRSRLPYHLDLNMPSYRFRLIRGLYSDVFSKIHKIDIFDFRVRPMPTTDSSALITFCGPESRSITK